MAPGDFGLILTWHRVVLLVQQVIGV